MMADDKGGITKYIADYLAVNIAVDLLVRSMNAKLDASKAENEKLREQLAQSDQQIEWLSKENETLKRDAAALLPELKSLNETVTKTTADALKWIARARAEIAKWKERSDELVLELVETNTVKGELIWYAKELEKDNAGLRGRVAFLKNALNSKPGTMYLGNGGIVISGYSSPPKEIIDAVESMRVEHLGYSCPLASDYSEPTDVCVCGADRRNAKVDRVLAYLRGEQS